MRLLFWISVVGVLYSYFIYPLVLLLIKRESRDTHQNDLSQDNPSQNNTSALPRLSLIVTAHNEAARIREKIDNCLQLEYPRELLEVIVASDCSTDDTDDVVRSHAADGIVLVRAEEHNGKEYAQSLAIKAAKGDILVFSDAATKIPADSLRLIASKFADPKVGAISSEDRFISDGDKVAGEGAYVKYEMWLRKLESQHAGLVGLSGSFFAARREICQQWDTLSPSDFNTALNCSRQGFISISCPDILGYYKDIKDPKREYQRKLRTIIRGLTAVSRQPEVLNPAKMGMFAFQVWSHKIMRWAVPWFMLTLLLSNLLLASSHWFYTLALLAQLGGYGLIATAWFKPSLQEITPVRILLFFVQVNLAIAHATLAFLSGRRMTVWTPSQR